MADRLPPVPKFGFGDEKGFYIWLTSLPEKHHKPFAQLLACRTALRVVPNLHATLSPTELTLATLRANTISRVALKYPTEDILAGAQSAMISVPPGATDLANTAANYANNSLSLAARTVSKGHLTGFTIAFDPTILAAPSETSAMRSTLWTALSDDARALAKGIELLDLLVEPLWSDLAEWWANSKFLFQSKFAFFDGVPSTQSDGAGWHVWVEWYNAVSKGIPPWDLPTETAWDLEKRIALGDGRGEEFWSREPEVINREIAGWVEAARNDNKITDEGKVPQEADFDLALVNPPEQLEDATQLTVNEGGKIDLSAPGPENRLLDTQSQRQEYSGTRTDALDLREAGPNRLGKLLPELEKLIDAMPEDFTASTVFDLWRAINRLRRTSNAHRALGPDADGHEAKLEPSVAEDLDHLLDGLNILAFNDPNLRQRDVNRIPPQDRTTNEAARELMEPLVEEVIQNEDLTTEAAAETVEADMTSASDADNTEHGAQAVDQAVKTERNTLAAFFSSLTQKIRSVMAGEAGFAWKEIRAGLYRASGPAAVTLAITEATGTTSVLRATFAYAVENATALKEVALQIFQNPRLAEMIDWIVKVFS